MQCSCMQPTFVIQFQFLEVFLSLCTDMHHPDFNESPASVRAWGKKNVTQASALLNIVACWASTPAKSSPQRSSNAIKQI